MCALNRSEEEVGHLAKKVEPVRGATKLETLRRSRLLISTVLVVGIRCDWFLFKGI